MESSAACSVLRCDYAYASVDEGFSLERTESALGQVTFAIAPCVHVGI